MRDVWLSIIKKEEVVKEATIELFEGFLGLRVYNGICRRCGEHASHQLVYCSRCGDTFFRPKEKCTLFELIKIADISTGRKTSCFRPDFQAAVFKRKLKERGCSDKEFQTYIEDKLEPRRLNG